jgi:hypothetical protein
MLLRAFRPLAALQTLTKARWRTGACRRSSPKHAGTVRVLHMLRPFAVAMAGAGEFDPFKD